MGAFNRRYNFSPGHTGQLGIDKGVRRKFYSRENYTNRI